MDAEAIPGPWVSGRGRHRHHRHRERGPGFLAMGRGPFGPFGWGDPRMDFMFRALGGHGRRRGPRRARRGDVRAALLVLLAEEARNGYQLIQEIEERSGGIWKPSPGSVYPALQQLEDEGLVRAQETDGRRTYALTDEGRVYVDENRDALGEPWEDVKGGMDEGVLELRGLIAQVAGAAIQCSFAGHGEEASRILAETRRQLYRVLAEDGPEPAEM